MRPGRCEVDYREAINRLLTLVDHERNRVTGPRQKAIYNLERMEAFLQRLDHPHRATPAIHVAGTKGKGSTAALCDSTLRAAGLSTGFYSSPHLHTFRERIRRDTLPVSEAVFANLVNELWPLRDDLGPDGPVTLFEFLTGMAFCCFKEDRTDVQTIEVGLGGRLDATNVVKATVSVITSVSLDHTAVLGDTVGEIAADKAGIIKPGAHVVVAPQSPEAMGPILEACYDKAAATVLVGRDVGWEKHQSGPDGQFITVHGRNGSYELMLPLLGDYQLENAATAVAALETMADCHGFPVTGEAIARGFAQVSWPCRMEVLSREPLLVADGAHNVYSIESLLASLPHYFSFHRLLLIAGVSRDKDVLGMVERMSQGASLVYATGSRHPRSMAPAELAGMLAGRGVPVEEAADPAEALAKATAAAGPDDMILATGSLFLAAEVREAVMGLEPETYPEISPRGREQREQ